MQINSRKVKEFRGVVLVHFKSPGPPTRYLQSLSHDGLKGLHQWLCSMDQDYLKSFRNLRFLGIFLHYRGESHFYSWILGTKMDDHPTLAFATDPSLQTQCNIVQHHLNRSPTWNPNSTRPDAVRCGRWAPKCHGNPYGLNVTPSPPGPNCLEGRFWFGIFKHFKLFSFQMFSTQKYLHCFRKHAPLSRIKEWHVQSSRLLEILKSLRTLNVCHVG